MAILIGGSPSTGSSLLRRILNRHSKVFCGSETSLFCKPELYSDWNNSRHKLFKKSIFGIKNAGYHHFIGLSMENDYGLKKYQILDLIRQSPDSMHQFIHNLYSPLLEKHNKSIWAEKTPGNVFCFQEFSKTFSHSKLIHIVRNPLDCITSLINRGMPMYQSIVTYLLNTSIGLSYQNLDEIHVIKYENLVSNPVNCLTQMFDFLELDFEPMVLNSDENSTSTNHMKGWKYKESENIATGSVGRFNDLEINLKEKINFYISKIQSNLSQEFPTIGHLAEQLNYKIPHSDHIDLYDKQLRNDRRKDMIIRTLKSANFNGLNYPITINEK